MTAALLAGLAGATVWFGFLGRGRRDPRVVERVAELAGSGTVAAPSLRLRGLVSAIGRRWPGRHAASNRELLVGAGLDPGAADLLRGAQLALAGAGFLFGLLLGPAALAVSPLGFLLGLQGPRLLLGARSRWRREEVARALPDAVDLLAVCCHAGLNIPLALRRVAPRAPGPLGREIVRTLEEMDLGAPRARALEAMAERNPLPDIESLVRLLRNSERFGTRIAQTLESFAADMRGRRRRAAEEQARRAPVKILFPLVFLILPAFVLLTVVPLLVGAFRSLDF